MGSEWRLLLTGARSGAENMALDEAVFGAVERDLVPPTLRLYAWNPACVSLGRLQPAEAVAREALRRRNLEVVRRLTGGRAILHQDEVTYSVAAPTALCPGGSDVMSTYAWISTGLTAGLANLGVVASLTKRTGPNSVRSEVRSASCFTSAARCDLVVGGRKLIGSAQARGQRSFLQHGSLPLTLEREALRELLGEGGDPGDAATDLTSLVGAVPEAHVRQQLVSGFETALQITLHAADLTEAEQRETERLAATKYDHLW